MELARVLVEAGIVDQPVEVSHAGLRGVMRYRSLHRMAARTMKENGQTPVKVARHEPFPSDAAPAGRVSPKTGVKWVPGTPDRVKAIT